MELTSSAFAPLGDIPSQHTCDGHDRSPPLAWSGVPSGAKSLALVVDDPDAPDPAAPKMTWVHWVLYNIPPATTGFEAGATQLPAGTCQGINDWQQAGYRGPCPPIGRHRYVPHAVRARHRPAGSAPGDQSRPGTGHAGAYPGPLRAGGALQEEAISSGGITSPRLAKPSIIKQLVYPRYTDILRKDRDDPHSPRLRRRFSDCGGRNALLPARQAQPSLGSLHAFHGNNHAKNRKRSHPCRQSEGPRRRSPAPEGLA